MRYIPDDRRFVLSASDLTRAADCEFAWVRALEGRMGRPIPVVEEPYDYMLERSARLGDDHELRQLQAYRARFGAGVVEIPHAFDGPELADAVERTREALRSDAAVVFQATFATDDFLGFADFIVRDDEGRCIVQDTKLARRAKVTALMQLAAYVEQLDRLDVPRSDIVQLLLGDGSVSTHVVDDIMPVFLLRRGRLRDIVAEREPAAGADGPVVAWGDERYEACGRCPTCEHEVAAARDLLLVAGLRRTQRRRFREAGITTIDDLAAMTAPLEGMDPQVFDGLRLQAALQIRSSEDAASSTAAIVPPRFEVIAAEALSAIPAPDDGDMFFDFEGDPLHTEGEGRVWGLDYLFGWVDARAQYTGLWAHSFVEERQALIDFVAEVHRRRAAHPGMHIYHYAAYERTHLLAMAARHGVCEADIDQILHDDVLVDLYPIVRRALRVGSPSYSIKKLEPLYMGDQTRVEMAVAEGGASIEQYVRAMASDAAERARLLEELRDYNEYDCVSTLRLRDWLRARAAENDVPYRPHVTEEKVYAEQPLAARLRGILPGKGTPLIDIGGPERTADEQAIALAAAAIDYFPRERRTYFADHFLRLEQPIHQWAHTRDVMVIDRAGSHIAEDWHSGERGRRSRTLTLRGEIAPGSRYGAGTAVLALYEQRDPLVDPQRSAGSLLFHAARIDEVDGETVTLREGPWRLGGGEPLEWDALPVALAPAPPPSTEPLERAIDRWARDLTARWPDLPDDAATAILRRARPTTSVDGLPRPVADDDATSIVSALRGMDHGYLAVQGPPGTGKTYVGSHVIARLVREHGWRIGVVAQSHSVVDTMLDRTIATGLSADRVAKFGGTATGATPHLPARQAGTFALRNDADGYVIGGTAWLFAGEQLRPHGLDLLVVDEAGQFGLAPTIAAAGAARRVLLLGDPQQLPQVSQGTHPEPIDTSALGWVIGDHDVLPPEFGYFLARSRRMHPAVAAPVSALSYEGELSSHPCTLARTLEGVEPGVHFAPVPHHGNTNHSAEEAARVVAIVDDLLGRPWTPGEGETRPLTAADIIVLAPYNAQLDTVRSALTAAGHGDVPVGTVDKFQGKEAPVAIYTLAASSAADAPRGLEFVLLRNRLNVAISRAQFAAYLVYSPGLLDDLPHTPDGVVRLSAFARLVGAVPVAEVPHMLERQTVP